MHQIVLLFFKNFIHIYHLICLMYCILLAIRLPFSINLSWVELSLSTPYVHKITIY